MSMTRGSRRVVRATATALLLLVVTAPAAGAVRLQADCDDRPVSIGCDRSSTTQTSTTRPGAGTPDAETAPTTEYPPGDERNGTTQPGAGGANVGAKGGSSETTVAARD